MRQLAKSLSAIPPEARGGRLAAVYSGTATGPGFSAHWPGCSAGTGAGNAPVPCEGPKSTRPAMARGIPQCSEYASAAKYPWILAAQPGNFHGNFARGFSRGNLDISRTPGFFWEFPGRRMPHPKKLAPGVAWPVVSPFWVLAISEGRLFLNTQRYSDWFFNTSSKSDTNLYRLCDRNKRHF